MKTIIFLLSFASIVLGQSTSARAIGDSPNTAHAVNLPNVKFDSIAPGAGFSACTPENCITVEAAKHGDATLSNTGIRWTVGDGEATIDKDGKIAMPKGVTQQQALKALVCWMGYFNAANTANCGDLRAASPEKPEAKPAQAATPTVATGQIGYGNSTTANTNCGFGVLTATGCLVVNIGGTAHYIPYN